MSTTYILILWLCASSVTSLPCLDPKPIEGGTLTFFKCSTGKSAQNVTCQLSIRKDNKSSWLPYRTNITSYSQAPDKDVGGNSSCSMRMPISYAESRNLAFRMLIDGKGFVAGCPNGTFGNDCLKRCHCNNGTCAKENGTCPGDCAPGFTGPTCSVNSSSHNVSLCTVYKPWSKLLPLHYGVILFMLISTGATLPFITNISKKEDEDDTKDEQENESISTKTPGQCDTFYDVFMEAQKLRKPSEPTIAATIWSSLPSFPSLPFFGSSKQQENTDDKKSAKNPLKKLGRKFSRRPQQLSQTDSSSDSNMPKLSTQGNADPSAQSQTSGSGSTDNTKKDTEDQGHFANIFSTLVSLPEKSRTAASSVVSSFTSRASSRRSTVHGLTSEQASVLTSNRKNSVKAVKTSKKPVKDVKKTTKKANTKSSVKTSPKEDDNNEPKTSKRQASVITPKGSVKKSSKENNEIRRKTSIKGGIMGSLSPKLFRGKKTPPPRKGLGSLALRKPVPEESSDISESSS